MTTEDGRAPSRTRIVLACLLLSAFAFLVGADRPGLIEKDEPRYAGTAREMVRGGDWLVPRFNGRERLVKPPLEYWAVAASFTLAGGEGERAARFPSALAATLTVLVTAWMGMRALGRRWGALAGPILATMLMFLVEARLATTDMLFTLFFTAAAAALVPALEGGAGPRRWILAGGVAAGLAALAKTPLALLLPPAAAWGAVLLLSRRGGPEAVPSPFRAGSRGRTLLAMGGATLLGFGLLAAWVLPANAAADGRLLGTLAREGTMRVANPGGFHYEPFWFYLPILAGAAFPWVLFLPAGIAAAWRERRNPSLTFCLLLGATILLFFSCLAAKLPAYVLPALPPLAVLAAAGLREGLAGGEGRPASLARWIPGAGGLVLAAAIAAAPAFPWLADPLGPALLPQAAPPLSAFAGLLALGALLFLARRPRAGTAAFLAAPLSMVIFAAPLLVHLGTGRSARDMGVALREDGIRPADRLMDATNELTGLPYYADHDTVTEEDGEGVPLKQVILAFNTGEPIYAVVEDDPTEKRIQGRYTQWERLRERLEPGVPAPRVVFRGLKRMVVTNIPPRGE